MFKPLMLCAVTGAFSLAVSGAADAQDRLYSPAEFDAMLSRADIRGPAGQAELVIPLDLPGWAADAGAMERVRKYKGICGPEGAAATIEQLVQQAGRDLTGIRNRGTMTTVTTVGDSPSFKITHDANDPNLLGLSLPDFVAAAEYVDSQFNNRVTASVTLAIEPLSGSTIGSASSEYYLIPWSTYVEGLREADDREDEVFANALPTDALPVRFGFPGTPVTGATSVYVTDTQFRAIFGNSAFPEIESVSISLNSNSSWAFFGCGYLPGSGEASLIDVVVHEIGHSIGFDSSIVQGGANPSVSVTCLDVARFLDDPSLGATPGVPGGPPTNASQFTTFPRHLQGAVASPATRHRYVSADGFSTLVEEGDGRQPSHLRFFSLFQDKLGIMDPVLNNGTSYCDFFFNDNVIKPLDDMGWTPIGRNALLDCNGNGQPDWVDINNGAPDTNTNNIPDSCEPFASPTNPGATRIGLTLSDWAAPGLSTLDGFNPANYTLQFRGETDDPSIDYGGSAGIVVRFSGYFDAPATGEHAFRVEHDEAATLRVAGQTLLAINGAREIQWASAATKIAPQNFISLNAGLHAFELTLILNSTGDAASVFADAPVFGGWGRLDSSDFVASVDNFPDCDNNGVDDQFDPDLNGDGIDDATQFAGDLAGRTVLGTVGPPDTPIIFETVGSDFDTEIGLYNAATGVLIEANDDIMPGNLQSRIVQNLTPGTYLLGVGSWSMVFDHGPAVDFPGECSRSGSAVVTIAGATISVADAAPIGSGRTRWYEFTVGAAVDCDGDGAPDEPQLTDDLANLTVLGVVGEPFEDITFETVGSSFDTEIALLNADTGLFIAANDDISTEVRQSRLVQRFGEGTYLLGVGGFNIEFLAGPEIAFPGTCASGGSLTASIISSGGTVSDSDVLPLGRTRWYQFSIAITPDCDNDGTPDDQEQDCDGNGIPDECELFDYLNLAAGVVGNDAHPIQISTAGSDFDTEIAVWRGDGTLLESNDDLKPPIILQSEIVRVYEPGDYLLAITGYNTSFSDFAPDFESGGVEFSQSQCAFGGSVNVQIGSVTENLTLPQGRAAFYAFTIEAAPTACNAADLAEPFGILDLADINAFVGGFTSQDPTADLDSNGLFDLSDINMFVAAFIAGCP